MSKKIQTNQKRMNQDNRVVIEKGLDTSKPLSSIARELGKDPATIAKEIKKHRIFQEHNRFNEPSFRCAPAKDCHRKKVCSTELFCKRECRRCPRCHNFCKEITRLLITTARKRTRPLMSAMPARKDAGAALTSTIAAPFPRRGNTGLSLPNPAPA